MGWLVRDERTASSWKLGWTERTLASLDAPPSRLLAIVGIVVVLMSISSYAKYKSQVQTTALGFRLVLLLLLLALIFMAHSVIKYGAILVVSPRTKLHEPASGGDGGGGSPWGVAVLLVLVVVLVSYQKYFHSMWWPWPPIWGPN